MTLETVSAGAARKAKVLRIALSYAISYLLGIVTCVLFTPVNMTLAGFHLWPLYPFIAVIGYFLFYLLEPQYVFGATFGYWAVFSLGLLFPAVGIAVHFIPRKRFLWWGPTLVLFAFGFIGTMGVFYTAAQTI